jgi:ribosomal protein S18 acetylase RimI-like enzyme
MKVSAAMTPAPLALSCSPIFGAARVNFNARAIKLNVYRGNLPAVRLYRSLGFVVASWDEAQVSYAMRLDEAAPS